jgi:hypothetical protein
MKPYNKLAMITVQLPLCLGNTHKGFYGGMGYVNPYIFHSLASESKFSSLCFDLQGWTTLQRHTRSIDAQPRNFSKSEASGQF